MKIIIQTIIACLIAVQIYAHENEESAPTACTTDSLALIALYNATDGTNWTNTWDLSQPMATWYGVSVNLVGCVDSLSLVANELRGNIPSEIGNLTNLVYLYLRGNQLSGSIPPEIGNLINLNLLSLRGNQLSGSIPSEIGNLTNLNWLNLSGNQLSGSIPSEIGNLTNLTYLYLHANQLSGSIPSEIGNLINLTKLYLYSNQLSGSIPSEIGNLTRLRWLNLSNNQLENNIPWQIGNLTDLINLDLSENLLSGCYDYNLTNLCSLNSIYLEGNNFDATGEDFCSFDAGVCPMNNGLVLPGNFNADDIANQDDLLYWGLAYDSTGLYCPDATTDWIPRECPDWDNDVDGINGKHQDGNGDGVVDENDIPVLEGNLGKTYGIHPFSFHPSVSSYHIELVETSMDSVIYAVYLQSAISEAHGLSGEIKLKNLETVYDVYIDTTGSALNPTFYIEDYDSGESMIKFAITRTDKTDVPITDTIPVLHLIVMDKDVQGLIDSQDSHIDSIGGGNIMIAATEEMTPIAGSVYNESNKTYMSASALINNMDCNRKGLVRIDVQEGVPPYAYSWRRWGDDSFSASDSTINYLEMGRYTVEVHDASTGFAVIDFGINWAFAPVKLTTQYGQICVNFEGRLKQAAQISLDGRFSYETPIKETTCYHVFEGNYDVWIKLANDSLCEMPLRTESNELATVDHDNSLDVTLLNSRTDVDMAQLLCYLPEEGTLHVSMYNMQGQLAHILHNENDEVSRELRIDVNKGNLHRGIYLIYVHFISKDGKIKYKTLKLAVI